MVLSDIFISYSRKDKVFVNKLNMALENQGKEVWIDWEDIPFSSKWWDEISQAIEGSGTFVCVLSPDYITSDICLKEISLAEKHNKRIIPVLCKEFDLALNKSNSISKINWIYFLDSNDFDKSFHNLLDTLNKDLEWIKFHTRLLVRALEWAKNKNDKSYHLYGTDLEDAITMRDNGVGKSPPINTLQNNFIESSQSGAAKLQIKQLRGFYVAALIYSIAQIIVIYFWNLDSISEEGMIKLSWVWLPGFSFAIAGFTIGKNSIKKSFWTMAVAMLLFFIFYSTLWSML